MSMIINLASIAYFVGRPQSFS